MKPDTSRPEKVVQSRGDQGKMAKGLRRRIAASGKAPRSVENRSDWDALDDLDSEHDITDDIDVDRYRKSDAPALAARRRIEQLLEEKWLNNVLDDFPDN